MDEYTLDASGFTEAELEDIKKCLNTLYSTVAGTIPMDRDFGLSIADTVSYPPDTAQAMLSVEIIAKTEAYEPRVKVESVDFETGTDGVMKPIIHIQKGDE